MRRFGLWSSQYTRLYMLFKVRVDDVSLIARVRAQKPLSVESKELLRCQVARLSAAARSPTARVFSLRSCAYPRLFPERAKTPSPCNSSRMNRLSPRFSCASASATVTSRSILPHEGLYGALCLGHKCARLLWRVLRPKCCRKGARFANFRDSLDRRPTLQPFGSGCFGDGPFLLQLGVSDVF